MAKKKQGSKAPAQRREAQRADAKEQARRTEAVRKNRQMSALFLFVLMGILAAICLFFTVKTFFFPADSLVAMRENYLLVSIFALPFLLAAAAILLRKLLKEKTQSFSDAGKRGCKVLFAAVCLGAALLFGVQMLTGRTSVVEHPVYKAFTGALDSSGASVSPIETTEGFRSALERMSLVTEEVRCGSCVVRFHYHEGGLGIPGRFVEQAGRDHSDLAAASETLDGVRVTRWTAKESAAFTTAALALDRDGASAVYELLGPEAEVQKLLDLLQDSTGKALGVQ